MSSETIAALDIQPGALLAGAPATISVAQFNQALADYGLCLPVDPLLCDLSLADLVRWNAGGRRRMRYGPIGRYLRAAVLGPQNLRIGGPTLKRSTGYGLNRALAGRGVELGTIHELTFNLRPLPAARAALLIQVPTLADACRLGASLAVMRLELSALAFAEDQAGAVLLAELEAAPQVLDRQVAEIRRVAASARAVEQVEPAAWNRWEILAAAQADHAVPALDLTLARTALPDLIARARTLALRYGFSLICWGDAGVGALHMRAVAADGSALTPRAVAEAEQALAVIAALARELGGDYSTEFGRFPVVAAAAQAALLPTLHNDSLSNSHRRVGTQGRRFVGMQGTQRAASLQLSAFHPDHVLAELRAIVGEPYLLTRDADVVTYETDASIARPTGGPLAVALPANTAEVAALVQVAADHSIPLVSRGAGSGLAGGCAPSSGALVIGLNRLEQITIDATQMVAHVGAGAVTAEIQTAAEQAGLFYPPDPSSQTASTIGGNIACNAGGPRCLKYGVTADYVLALTAVLADGSVVRWGDGLAGQGPTNGLAQLLSGSEGTLAIITEATLRLIPKPAARRTTMAIFADLEAACATVEQIMAAGIMPAGLELMDDTTIAAVEAFLKIGLPADAGAMLLMLSDGEPEQVNADAERLADLARAGGAIRVQTARDAADEANLWKARRVVSIALTRVRPNRLGEDISVPIPQIVACVRRIKQISAEHNFPIVVYGHAGDGNLHPNILFDGRNPEDTQRLWPAAEAIFAAALAVGGTLSGEHGIGTLKRPFMRQALGDDLIAVQQQLKDCLDPHNLLNPGKVLPEKGTG